MNHTLTPSILNGHSPRHTLVVTSILLMVPLLWGFGYPLIRASMGEIGAFQFLVYRFGIALVPLAIVFRHAFRTSLSPSGATGSCWESPWLLRTQRSTWA